MTGTKRLYVIKRGTVKISILLNYVHYVNCCEYSAYRHKLNYRNIGKMTDTKDLYVTKKRY